MTRVFLGLIMILSFSVQVFSANVGDKINITGLVVMCNQYEPKHARYWLIHLLKGGASSYIEKVSNGKCLALPPRDDSSIVGKVIKKKYQVLSKKEFDALAQNMKFEILKIDIISIMGKKIGSDYDKEKWFALPLDIETYKIIK